MSTTLTRRLPELAAEITKEHELCAGALAHAIKCGELLIEAKEQLSHGECLPWIAANTPLSRSMAAGYMQLARVPNVQPVGHLGVKEALRSIARPADRPPPHVDLRAAFGGTDQGELDAAMAELDAMPQESRFPSPGLEREVWREIGQSLERVGRFMEDASRDGLSVWSRQQALHEGARHARNAASQLSKLADSLAA